LNCHISELPYASCNVDLFSHFADQNWALFLDSCVDLGASGQYDIIAFEPFIQVQARGQQTLVTYPRSDRGSKTTCHTRNFYDVLKEQLQPFEEIVTTLLESAQLPSDLPFYGGAIGHFNYDLNNDLNNDLNTRINSELNIDPSQPELATTFDANIGVYDCFIVVDHAKKKTFFIDLGFADSPRNENPMQSLLNQPQDNTAPELPLFKLTQDFRLDSSATHYQRQYQRIIDYIYAGDCYQVNFAQRLSSVFTGHLWNAYKALRSASPAPYSAFMVLPDTTLLSHSPESFLSVEDQQVITCPIKGTRRRSNDPAEDQLLQTELRESAKDQAENLMIVDLMRNDLGRHCRTGSVAVNQLFELKSFSNVHHLVSSIQGQLKPNSHPLDLLKDSFPGGSITGAPKRRAMEIIDELEPYQRGPYCGSLGYISFDGRMNTSIAIRTLYSEEGNLYCWGGGGIVADSNCSDEYCESQDKINNLIQTLNNLQQLSEPKK